MSPLKKSDHVTMKREAMVEVERNRREKQGRQKELWKNKFYETQKWSKLEVHGDEWSAAEIQFFSEYLWNGNNEMGTDT